jgi:hypothetical protein
MRVIFEALGAGVDWDADSRTATGTKDGLSVSLTIDDSAALVNGTPILLDTPAHIENDRVLVPLRLVAESLQSEVIWDADRRAVFIFHGE